MERGGFGASSGVRRRVEVEKRRELTERVTQRDRSANIILVERLSRTIESKLHKLTFCLVIFFLFLPIRPNRLNHRLGMIPTID